MSNLEELIERLCPDGVKAVELGQVAHYAKNRIDADAVTENTYVGVENLLQNKAGKTVAVSVPTKGTVIAFNPNDILIGNIRPYLKKIWLSDCAGGTNGDVLVIQIDERERLLPKYLFYVLSSDRFFLYDMQNSKGAKMPRGNKAAILKYRIPVPPLPVQGEIVRILDNFTELTAELTAELAAELAARQKQYEYYKEYLFENHIFDVEWKRLDELFPFIRNGFVGTIKSFFTNETDGIRYLEGTNIHDGVISDNEVLYVTKEFHKKHIKNQLKSDDILMVQSGHIGECAVVGKKYEGSNCHALIIMSNGGKCLSKYYVYYFHTIKGFKSLTPAITGGTIKHVLAGKVGKIKVPVPSLEQQQRIVDILDRFDALCNDITSGLPAEIEMRQKQYEYYRDKLLTFKELKKEA